jgi:predicted nucleotidyltransferase
MKEKFIDIIHSDDKKHNKLAKILSFIIEECGVKKDSYFLLGSYALREVRTISDLDINMDSKEFEKFKKLDYGKIEPYDNETRWFFDMTKEYQKIDPETEDFSIEIFKKKPTDGYPNNNFSLKYLKEHNGLNKDKFGHQYFSLETLLKWKQTMNRPKDQLDIERIKKLLSDQDGGYYKKYVKYKSKYLYLKKIYIF